MATKFAADGIEICLIMISLRIKVKRMIKFILSNIPVRKFDVRVVNLASNELLRGRVALITGGTSGIGFLA